MKDSEGGYTCLDCGLEIYDDTHNSYLNQSYLIVQEAIKTAAVIHCITEGHHRLRLRGTDIRFNVGFAE
jgi:hypothetical protein